mmetsp:Transcript_56925/g.166699  ORF Transcript_56925/g.166699 Transcript_56925/m.166699 type:complete len:495 (-) Transcript_56925:92-1576(-)
MNIILVHAIVSLLCVENAGSISAGVDAAGQISLGPTLSLLGASVPSAVVTSLPLSIVRREGKTSVHSDDGHAKEVPQDEVAAVRREDGVLEQGVGRGGVLMQAELVNSTWLPGQTGTSWQSARNAKTAHQAILAVSPANDSLLNQSLGSHANDSLQNQSLGSRANDNLQSQSLGSHANVSLQNQSLRKPHEQLSGLERVLAASNGTCLPAPVMNPPEVSRSYSSVYANMTPGTYHARSMLGSPLAWQALQNVVGESMTIDLGSLHVVRGSVTQGRAIRRHPEWVNKLRVEYSEDGIAWHDAGLFEGNSDSETRRVQSFEKPVTARYVRFVAVQWHSHISMRAGVLPCQPCMPGPTLNPPEQNRTYSSTFGHLEAPGDVRARSSLGSPGAWTAERDRAGEWMLIALPDVQLIRGTVLQGRSPLKTAPSWVVKYHVHYSLDGRVFYPVGLEFEGNWDGATQSEQLFGIPIEARYVRLLVVAWHGSISMRAGLLTCR